MKKINLLKYALLLTLLITGWACNKNYITGGKPDNVNAYANVLTYDLLNGNPLYDTLVKVIDAAGLKDQINASGSTFFAPSDFSVLNYLQVRTLIDQNVDPAAQFGLDSLLYYVQNNINNTKDSLLLYLVSQKLDYSVLTNAGTKYETALAGDTVVVSYEATTDVFLGYSSVVSGIPRVVYFTQLWYPYDLSASNPAGEIPVNIGVRTLVRTSGIQTKNGIMNALDNSHILFFSGTKQ